MDVRYAYVVSAILFLIFKFSIGALPSLAEDQAPLATLLPVTTDANYSYYGYSYPGSAEDKAIGFDVRRQHFARGTKVGDLVDAEGNLILFRNINGPYMYGFIDDGNAYIAKEGNAYSYSLTPSIINSWSSPNKKDSYTLIAIQNVDTDDLRTKTQKAIAPGNILSEQPPLTRDFKIQDIAYCDEVKVPVGRENVIAIVKQSDFKKVMDEFGSKPFHLKEFLKKLAMEPSFRGIKSSGGKSLDGTQSLRPGLSCGNFYKRI